MSKNKNSKQNKPNKNPYTNEIKEAKESIKLLIDAMSDEEFVEFSYIIALIAEDDDIDYEGEDWEEFLDDEDIPF